MLDKTDVEGIDDYVLKLRPIGFRNATPFIPSAPICACRQVLFKY